MAKYKRMNLNEIVEYLESILSDDDDEIDPEIYVQPPDVAYDSGQDEADECEGGVVHNLHFDQLRQTCEVRTHRKDESDEEDDTLPDEEHMIVAPPDNASTSTTSKQTPTTSIEAWKYLGPQIEIAENVPRIANKFSWTQNQVLTGSKNIFPEANYIDCVVPAHELFERFFDEDLLQMIVDSSNGYGIYLEQTNPDITIDELRVFIGIMIISGYCVVADRTDYWTAKSDMHNEMISEAMSRNRFNQISRFIHFTDQRVSETHDKMWKLRPLFNRLNQNFLRNFHPEQDLSFDESMIPYFGRHSCKQYIKGNPLRFGYKAWCLNTPSGYLVSFSVYQGKDPYVHPGLEKTYGKCVAPLLQMIHSFPDHIRVLPFCFYFDNLFTGIAVLDYLKSLGFHATGTIRENRIPRNCPLPKKEIVKKKPRGHIEYAEMQDPKIAIVKWNDNNSVSVASTLYGKLPISRASRFSQEEKKRILVDHPYAVEQYNKFMGGTDRMDQNIGYYRIGVRKNKWWWAIFTWLVDVAIQNAWLLQKKTGVGQVSNLQFRRKIASYYCTTVAHKIRVKQTQRRYNLPNEARFDGITHYVAECSRRRCAYGPCKSQTRNKCVKCDVGLCVKYFIKYHTIAN